jgi:hypothetical protein
MNRFHLQAAAAALVLGLAACGGVSTTSSPSASHPPAPGAASATAGPSAAPASAVTVCTVPYAASTCASNEKSQPQSISLSGDGSINLGSITWSGWGSATATGHGTAYINSCQPSCAQGTQSRVPVTVTVTSLQPWNTGQAYDDMSITGLPQSYQSALGSLTGLAP